MEMDLSSRALGCNQMDQIDLLGRGDREHF